MKTQIFLLMQLFFLLLVATERRVNALVRPSRPLSLDRCSSRSSNWMQLPSKLWCSTSAASEHSATLITTDNAPTWDMLRQQVLVTPTGARLKQEANDRVRGSGPPHTGACVRLFDDTGQESEIRVTFYRDEAAWCPYCQRVWLLLEEKRIPHTIERVPLNAYGDKPAWYTQMVDGGKLPVIKLDGILYEDSATIMQVLDDAFSNDDGDLRIKPVAREDEEKKSERMSYLIKLEKQLQSVWFSLTFYPVEGEALINARENLLRTLQQVNDELGLAPSGPWFLGGDVPSIVDVLFISTVERIIASVLYWKGLVIRNTKFDNIDQWLLAFESRPSYVASKSDYYTLVMAIPSQNGPGYMTREAKTIAAKIYGLDGGWELPLDINKPGGRLLEPLPTLAPPQDWDDASRHEAAYRIIDNHANVVKFACRGAGEAGRPSYHAELADPCAESNEEYFAPVDVCLRHVTYSLLGGVGAAKDAATQDLYGKGGNAELPENWEPYQDEDTGYTYFWNCETGDVSWTKPTKQLDTCLFYLRDRIGVPRDMSYAAAMQLRAHLNWVTKLMS